VRGLAASSEWPDNRFELSSIEVTRVDTTCCVVDDNAEDDSRVRVHFKSDPTKTEDPEAIELLLDPDKLNKTGASGDGASPGGGGGGRGSPSRWRDAGGGPDGRPRLWQRLRRQWREFRLRFARRFSRIFNRRRYRATAAPALSSDRASAASTAD